MLCALEKQKKRRKWSGPQRGEAGRHAGNSSQYESVTEFLARRHSEAEECRSQESVLPTEAGEEREGLSAGRHGMRSRRSLLLKYFLG